MPSVPPTLVLAVAIRPVSFSHRTTGGRQSTVPSSPAPEAFHRSYQVCPGCASSQSKVLIRPSLRAFWLPGLLSMTSSAVGLA